MGKRETKRQRNKKESEGERGTQKERGRRQIAGERYALQDMFG